MAVVGGGLSGVLFALKLSRARPDFRVVVIQSGRRLGRGVAYGACSPQHLLNVPVSRMEVGLKPGFGEWLSTTDHARTAMAPALVESDNDLQGAFAPRALFGDYLQARVSEALITGRGPGLAAVRGEVVRVTVSGGPRIRLADGREVEADMVVLATGNMAPRAPSRPDGWIQDSPWFTPDPWAIDAFDGLDPGAPMLLIGTGLTTVDIALKLRDAGHRGPLLALSRRGLAPTAHAGGGDWPPFLEDALPASPRQLTQLIRHHVALALASGVPWQRVFDAARPAIPAVWRNWTLAQKRQFLRHLRTRWDVHRHRMAPRIASALADLISAGGLTIKAGRISRYTALPGPDGVEVRYRRKDGSEGFFIAMRVINCTGPQRDLAETGIPLIADLREQGLASPDGLGLGLETEDGALLDHRRRPSDCLFALGALTCPSWWEITAVPEISVQVDRLVAKLAKDDGQDPSDRPLAAEDFLDLGAGI